MTEQEWRDLYACVLAAESLSSSSQTIEAARRAQEYLEGIDHD